MHLSPRLFGGVVVTILLTGVGLFLHLYRDRALLPTAQVKTGEGETRQNSVVFSEELLTWLGGRADVTPFDFCFWNTRDQRPGSGTFGCDWQLMALEGEHGECSLRLEVNSYDPEIGWFGLIPDYVINIAWFPPPRSPENAAMSVSVSSVSHDVILGKSVYTGYVTLRDGFQLKVFAPVPNFKLFRETASNMSNQVKWEAFMNDLTMFVQSHGYGQELGRACRALSPKSHPTKFGAAFEMAPDASHAASMAIHPSRAADLFTF